MHIMGHHQEPTHWQCLSRFKLIKLIGVIFVILLSVSLFIHYYIVSMDQRTMTHLSHSAHSHKYLPEEMSFKDADLEIRVKELLRIKGSVSGELRDMEHKRQRLQSDLQVYAKEIEQLKVELLHQQTELSRLKISVHQAQVAQQEALQQNTPDLAPPVRLMATEPPAHFPAPHHSAIGDCRMDNCFDHSRCSLTSGFPVYLYDPDLHPMMSSGWDVDGYLKTTLKQVLGYNPHLTSDPGEACVYLVLVGEALQDDDTDDDSAGDAEQLLAGGDEEGVQGIGAATLGNGSTSGRQRAPLDAAALRRLPYWGGDGRNHVLLNLARRELSASAADVFSNVNTGRAILVQSTYMRRLYRTDFDVVVAPVLGPPGGDVWLECAPMLPARRKYLLTFQGEMRMAPKFTEKWEHLETSANTSHFHQNVDHLFTADVDEELNEFTIAHLNGLLKTTTQDRFKFEFECNPASDNNRNTGPQARIYEALRSGAIPVVLGGDQVRLAFDEVIQWRRLSILLPRARITELHFLLRTFPDADLLAMRRQGRLVWERYLASAQSILDTVLALLRHRLSLPAAPAESVAAMSVFNDTFQPAQMVMGLQSGDPDQPEESLGPLEPSYNSPTYRRNYSLSLTQGAALWNDGWGDPFRLYTALPREPLLPSDAKFIGSQNGFRPIAQGQGGSGKEFSEALGGNHPREQFTVILLTYEREQVLLDSVARLRGLPYLNAVIVVWNSPRPPSPELRWPDIGVPLHVIRAARNSLNNRFLPLENIMTEAVLSVDDDAHLRHDEILFGFRVWREHRDRIVGFPGRYHAWDVNTHNSWLYNSNYSCELSMVLTGAAFIHNHYLHLYWKWLPQAIRDKVDEYMNCEDIAMNFLVSHITRAPPIKVTSRWTFRCPGCPQSLSEDETHFQERHKCINFFVQVFGYMPLLNTQYRADSILFKTRIPHDKQKMDLLVPPAAPTNLNGSSSVMTEVTALMKQWDDENTQPTFNPIPTLTRLSEIIETETENYLKMDPDPFDERHPSRTDPDCKLGLILKALFRKDHFMNRLVNDYLRDTYFSRLNQTGPDRDIIQLNISACRLMLDVLPGLETSVVFQPETDSLIHRLFKWSTDAIEPLQSYATGLLASAMELPDIATRFRERNSAMVSLLLQRLKRLQNNSHFFKAGNENSRPFAHLSHQKSSGGKNEISKIQTKGKDGNVQIGAKRSASTFLSPEHHNRLTHGCLDTGAAPRKRMKLDHSLNGLCSPPGNRNFAESSNSSWAELETFMIGSIQIFPPTQATRQILILRYLTPMGEYQEFLSHVFEHNALELILSYVNVRETKEARLAFEALKYLAALLCHKKFSIEFIQCGGLEAVLEVPRPSIAATGVSICLYYMGYCEEAMERVCLLPKYVVNNLVRYALWLLECSHDSGRCHATMFFGVTFQFKIILEEFDGQDGLRTLHNVISTLPILSGEDHMPSMNEDAECAARQIVRHVCVAYKRYLEAHLNQRVDQLHRAQIRPPAGVERPSSLPPFVSQPDYKACKSTFEDVQQQIDTLTQLLPFRAHWHPVDHLLKLGGITLLLKIIAFSYEWNYSGRAETVRCALDVLAIASVMPRVQLLFCERVDLPEEAITVGMNIILGAVEGEIVADVDVQKAALRVIVNCVCSPVNRVGGSVARYSASGTTTGSPSKKTKVKSSEELIQKVWESVRSNSGIMVLLHLMNIKTPITDADCIRTLACKALAGLARSDTVRQIVSKLPLFTNGQLQNLMRDPILQEKRQEHVSFQKHALELLERLSGKAKHTGDSLDVSLINIHRANVVAQTKIQFNDTQLLQLIHHHLVAKGLDDTATLLQREANLLAIISSNTSNNTLHPSKFRYTPKMPITPTRNRLSSLSMQVSSARNSPAIAPASSSTAPPISAAVNITSTIPIAPPIKLVKKYNSVGALPTYACLQQPNSRLQKQTSSELFMKAATPGQPLFACVSTTPPDSGETTCVAEPRITLDAIITEYLTNQHALCKNPMATCPQFNLFVPHKCPDPKLRHSSANNFAIRNVRQSMGYASKQLDRKFIHSRFCPVQTIRLPTDDGFFSCARFMPLDQSIIVGDYTGEVRIFNMFNGNELGMFVAHDSYIVHIEPSWDGQLVLTSSTWGRPQSALWSLKTFEIQYPFLEEEHVEFSHSTQDRILGTRGETATIYDTATGNSISKLSPVISNQYTKNKATFSPNDELVLSDGVLYDVSSAKQIHKLDKLNQTQSGVFHPNGLQIVSNTEVWDLRTFHLLKTVPTLNQCHVVFTPCNNAIYAIATEQLTQEDDPSYDSSFKTLDASDYSSIATIDVKRYVYDLAVNRYDTQIALVENQGQYNSIQESVVRVYDVGRRRDDEDDQEEEEEDEDDDDDDLDGSDDDGSDNDGPMVLDLLEGLDGNSRDEDDGDGSDDNSDSWTDLSSSSTSDNSYSPDLDDL